MRRILATLLVSLAGSCVALVDEPIAVVPCDASSGACPDGLECGYFAATVERDGANVNLCLPESCLQGASCRSECACACEGCSEDELCDVDHSESDRSDGKGCVPVGCFDEESSTFRCGTVMVDGAPLTCLPCTAP